MTGKMTRVRMSRELAKKAMRALGVKSRTEALSKLVPRFNVGIAARFTMAAVRRRSATRSADKFRASSAPSY